MRILVTGGCGFIGSNFVRRQVRTGVSIVVLDALTYAGKKENIPSDVALVRGDVANINTVRYAFESYGPFDAVVHFAAETHVDRSIDGPQVFVRTNALGTANLLTVAEERDVKKFVHISTDEVYGEVLEGAADESWPLRPRSPYAASKAAGDHLVAAWVNTYNLPAVIVRPCNTYGARQFPEKLIPLAIARARAEKPIPVYGDGKQVREWIFVDDTCDAIDLVLTRGQCGEIYNVGTGERYENLQVVKEILGACEALSGYEHVEDRAGHDRRYAIDSTKIRALGWVPRWNFAKGGLEATVEWYRKHS